VYRIKYSILLYLVALVCAGCGGQRAAGFALSSATFSANGTLSNQQVLNGFGCSGANESPELRWSNPPSGTKSYAITMYDPDAPTGSGWWHWVVYNIPAGSTSLPAGAGDSTKALLPQGATQGATDFGQPGYGGPCPPQGDKAHRYVFTIHAVDVERLDVPANATAALIGFNLHGHTLAEAALTASYSR
jgi:Raf kinase inhibitor-like YbhB/YbcL family protein